MNKLRNYRNENGLTVSQLAEKMGVHPCTVYAWETGNSHPKLYQIRRLEQLLGCDTDMLGLIPASTSTCKPKKPPAEPDRDAATPLYAQFMALTLDEQRYILAYTTPEPYRTAVKRIREGRITADEAAMIQRMMERERT